MPLGTAGSIRITSRADPHRRGPASAGRSQDRPLARGLRVEPFGCPHEPTTDRPNASCEAGAGVLGPRAVSRLCNLRSKIQLLGDPINFQQISRPEVQAFAVLADVNAGGGVLRKEIPKGEITVGDDGPQADGNHPLGLIGGKLADLPSSRQRWQVAPRRGATSVRVVTCQEGHCLGFGLKSRLPGEYLPNQGCWITVGNGPSIQ